jgi:hypothetical protein
MGKEHQVDSIKARPDKHKAVSPRRRAGATMKVPTLTIGDCHDTVLRNRFTFK